MKIINISQNHMLAIYIPLKENAKANATDKSYK